MPHRHNERGFAVYAEINTNYGHPLRVQQSSSAGEPKCFLFVGESAKVEGFDPHLTAKQALQTLAALAEFVQDSGITEGTAIHPSIVQLAAFNEMAAPEGKDVA